MKTNGITIDERLSIEDIVNVARFNYQVKLSNNAIKRINKSRECIDNLNDMNKLCYGINTGLGDLCDTLIDNNKQKEYQKNILLSHACGSGESYSNEIVRAAMLILINSIAKGYSGTSLEVVLFYIEMLNRGITPLVPQKGSLGASGDLVPLAHMALPLIGYGKVNYEGKIYKSKELLNKLNINLVDLKSKDALSIINGTHFMTAVGVLLVNDAYNLIKIADCSSALSVEALNGMIDNFNPKVHELRAHYGQNITAKIMNKLLDKSEYVKKHSDLKAQDAYSIRCIPQVHGASKDAFNYVKGVLNTEINSVTDNPLVFSSNEIISGGNFHGQPLAISFDFLSIALSELCKAHI